MEMHGSSDMDFTADFGGNSWADFSVDGLISNSSES
jgi:hypothetical protein